MGSIGGLDLTRLLGFTQSAFLSLHSSAKTHCIVGWFGTSTLKCDVTTIALCCRL